MPYKDQEKNKASIKAWNDAHKDLKKERDRKHYLENPEYHRQKGMKYFHENREHVRELRKAYYQAHREEAIRKASEWQKENSEKRREYMKEYKQTHREDTNARQKRYYSDVNKKLVMEQRVRLRIALKYISKTVSTRDLFGCSVEELRKHIEFLWKPGMTWDNWGRKGWHIDHVKTCASFDLSDPEQQRVCFHYTNLQPLWAKSNLEKGRR